MEDPAVGPRVAGLEQLAVAVADGEGCRRRKLGLGGAIYAGDVKCMGIARAPIK